MRKIILVAVCFLYFALNAFPQNALIQYSEHDQEYYFEALAKCLEEAVDIQSYDLLRDRLHLHDEFMLFLWNQIQTGTISYMDVPRGAQRHFGEFIKKRNLVRRINQPALFHSNNGSIEVRDGDDIYTYPCPFEAELPNRSSAYFYSSQVDMHNRKLVNICNMAYRLEHVLLDRISINGTGTTMKDCFGGTYYDKAQIFTPYSIIRVGDSYLMSYTLTFQRRPSIVFTQPRYQVLGGRLMELSSGVSYEERVHTQGFISLLSYPGLKVKNTATYDGIKDPRFMVFNDHVYFYNYSHNEYSEKIATENSPLYIMDTRLEAEMVYTPESGEVISDLVEHGDYVFLCGHSTKHGYVGYSNPTIVVIDMRTHEVRKRYIKKNAKDMYYSGISFLDDNYVMMQLGNTQYEILPVSDLLPEGVLPSVQKKPFDLQAAKQAVSSGAEITIQQKNGKYGALNKTGELIVPFLYYDIERVVVGKSNERAIAYREDDKVGVYDMNGNIVVPFDYEYVAWAGGREYIVSNGNEAGVIDEMGMWQFKGDYSFVKPLSITLQSRYMCVRDNDLKWGLVTYKGLSVLDNKYDGMHYAFDDKLLVQEGEKWGLVNLKGELVEPFIHKLDDNECIVLLLDGTSVVEVLCTMEDDIPEKGIQHLSSFDLNKKYPYKSSDNRADAFVVVKRNDYSFGG